MRARLGCSPPETLAIRLWTCAPSLLVTRCTFFALCLPAIGVGAYTVHMVLGDGQSKGTGNGHQDGASSCFTACMLLCFLAAVLHP